MKLVDNARQSWRWFSMQVLAFIGLLPLVWEMLPPESQALVPEAWRPIVITVLALIGIGGRLVKQGDLE